MLSRNTNTPPFLASAPLSYPGFPPRRWPSMKPTEKHFRCNICQRGFTRIDHLKRHHLRHSGQKPYSCIFCADSFARCDNLRDHYTLCSKRGDHQIPETGQRGRRRHACQSCTSMKLRCDGQTPCGSCEKRNLACNNERTGGNHFDPEEGTSANDKPYTQPPSDRGSIKFLLNSGTDSFTEDFRLPPRSDRALGADYYNRHGWEETQNTGLAPDLEGSRPGFGSGVGDLDPATPQFAQESFLDFFNGPFGDGQKAGGSYKNDHAYQTVMSTEQNPAFGVPAGQPIFEPERPFAMALIQSILGRSWQVPLDPKSQQELSADLNFVLTTARVRKFIALYFKYWHPSCPLLHVSFHPETVPLPLLAAVAFMGAMYSNDQREAFVAKRVLDFAELYVFSSDVFLAETDIGIAFTGEQCYNDEKSNWVRFQNYQAGFIILVAQYWAGSRVSRNRAMEIRFSEVVKVARRMGLPKSRHLPEDQVHEHLWIQKECRIRTISVISLLDCAFYFYQNYPCRLTQLEMNCDLPCEESIFLSAHPFAEPNFRFSRGLTVSEAFGKLLHAPQSPPMYLTIFDMFILIHLLYSFINAHMAILGPFIRMPPVKSSETPGSDSRQERASIPDDGILGAIKTALSRWRDYWVELRNRVSNEEWASIGFFKNAYNFWLVSQLLITKKDAVDVIMHMEVNCEDKLEKLKILLQDEQEDV